MRKGHNEGLSPVPGTSKIVTVQSCDDIEINMDYHHSNNLTNAAAPVRSFYEFPTVMPNPEKNSQTFNIFKVSFPSEARIRRKASKSSIAVRIELDKVLKIIPKSIQKYRISRKKVGFFFFDPELC